MIIIIIIIIKLQYYTHPHSIKTSRKLSKMRPLSGSGRSRGYTCCLSLYRVPKHSKFIAQKHCIGRDLARQLLCTRTSRISGITVRLDALREAVPASFSVAKPCTENRSISSRTRRRNANLCTLPISLCPFLQPVAYREGGFGVFKPPPPRNSEDIGEVLDRMSKKNRRLDFHL